MRFYDNEARKKMFSFSFTTGNVITISEIIIHNGSLSYSRLHKPLSSLINLSPVIRVSRARRASLMSAHTYHQRKEEWWISTPNSFLVYLWCIDERAYWVSSWISWFLSHVSSFTHVMMVNGQNLETVNI